MKQAIAFRAAEQVNDFLPMSKRDIIKFEGPALAWKKALARPGSTCSTFRSWKAMTASPRPS
jgi:hypothetical protein